MSKRQLVEELHKSVRKNFKRRKVIIKGLDETWSADLVDMSAYSKQNKGFHFILTVIDNFSKYAWVVPLKNKNAESTTNAMRGIFETKHGTTYRYPKNLQTDDGTEFFNSTFSTLMEKYEINHYSVFTHIKSAICERFNKSLKSLMWKEFSMNGNYRWIDLIDELCNFYNNRVHSTIKMKPVDVNKTNEKKLFAEVYDFGEPYLHPPVKKTKFRVGDHVRISKYKHIFEKSYTANFTTEIFRISKIQFTNPETYLLIDEQSNPIKGGFYKYELQKVKDSTLYLVEKVLRRKGNQAYVKWLRLGDEHNSWVNKKDII